MRRIKEDYVSFEVAKLLKAKGFKGEGEHFYEDDKITNFIDYWFRITPKQRYEAIEAPTLQMAMKWLRDEKNIHIKVHCSGNRNYLVYIQSLVTAFQDSCIESATCSFNTYEQACEAAIKYCLENLI